MTPERYELSFLSYQKKTYTNSRQNSVGQIKGVCNSDKDELGVVEVRPLEESVQNLLAFTLQLINFIENQKNQFLGTNDFVFEKLLRFVVVPDEAELWGWQNGLGKFAEHFFWGAESHAVDEDTI